MTVIKTNDIVSNIHKTVQELKKHGLFFNDKDLLEKKINMALQALEQEKKMIDKLSKPIQKELDEINKIQARVSLLGGAIHYFTKIKKRKF